MFRNCYFTTHVSKTLCCTPPPPPPPPLPKRGDSFLCFLYASVESFRGILCSSAFFFFLGRNRRRKGERKNKVVGSKGVLMFPKLCRDDLQPPAHLRPVYPLAPSFPFTLCVFVAAFRPWFLCNFLTRRFEENVMHEGVEKESACLRSMFYFCDFLGRVREAGRGGELERRGKGERRR